MKNTTKRVWSILLAICMLASLMTAVAYAGEGISITKQPESVTAAKGEKVTLSIEAEGDDLQYCWYSGFGFQLTENPGFSGADTATLTIESADCQFNDTDFYCEVYKGNTYVYSESAYVTVPHAEPNAWDYFYNESHHYEFCVDCGQYHSQAPHEWGDDAVCDFCGYDAQNPNPSLPIFFSEYQNVNVGPGETVDFWVDAFGMDLTYQWYKRKMDDDPMNPDTKIKLTDGDGISGVTTDVLSLEDVTCDMTGYFYICEVTNGAGTVSRDAALYVNHVPSEWKPDDGSYHMSYCVCGTELYSEYHRDEDCDGFCDVCEYEFPANAPKITAHPKNQIGLTNGHEGATFTVSATGENLTYQWYEMGMPIEDDEIYSGAKTATLTVKSIYDAENEIYDCAGWFSGFYCVISNDLGAITSEAAIYQVEHAGISESVYLNEYYHENYCICGEWMETSAHFDKTGDGKCDLCKAKMPELFSDLETDKWYYDAVVYVKSEELFIGDGENFLPNHSITRGEVATVLARAAFGQEQLDEMTDAEFEEFLAEWNEDENKTDFSDIDGKYYERYVRTLAAIGIIKGYDDGNYGGQDFITRQELAALLVRFAKYIGIENDVYEIPVESFTDGDEIAEWAKEDVEIARKMGLFLGDDDANFMPYADTIRAEVAQVLCRAGFYAGMIG